MTTRFRVALALDEAGEITGRRTSMMTADYLAAMDRAHQEKGL